MWMLKGFLIGVVMFVVGAIVYMVLALRADAQHSEARAVGLGVISYMTIYNPYFWASLVAALVIGCAVVQSWPTGVRVS
jgi:hypothetical protein